MAVVRMKDIARDLGVSVVTVSKAMRNHDDISEETRARVLQRMRDLNYRPNLAARALVTGRSFIVGFVVPGLLHSFFAEVAKGMTNVFRKNGYGLVLATSEEDPELERQEIEQLLARHVDALIVASTQEDDASFRRIEQQNIPYVLIDRWLPTLEANFVGLDDVAMGFMATEHLIESGCRRVACIHGTRMSPSAGRLKGYKLAMEKHGIALRQEYQQEQAAIGDAAEEDALAAMRKLLDLPERPDGVYAFNDPTAMNAMKLTLAAGLRIPEDIAFVGTGNIRYGDFLRVPLTTVDQNSLAIGARAAELALALIEAKTQSKATSILLEPRLIVRASSMRSPG